MIKSLSGFEGLSSSTSSSVGGVGLSSLQEEKRIRLKHNRLNRKLFLDISFIVLNLIILNMQVSYVPTAKSSTDNIL